MSEKRKYPIEGIKVFWPAHRGSGGTATDLKPVEDWEELCVLTDVDKLEYKKWRNTLLERTTP